MGQPEFQAPLLRLTNMAAWTFVERTTGWNILSHSIFFSLNNCAFQINKINCKQQAKQSHFYYLYVHLLICLYMLSNSHVSNSHVLKRKSVLISFSRTEINKGSHYFVYSAFCLSIYQVLLHFPPLDKVKKL